MWRRAAGAGRATARPALHARSTAGGGGQAGRLPGSVTARAYASWRCGSSRWLAANKTQRRPGSGGGDAGKGNAAEAKAENLPPWIRLRSELESPPVVAEQGSLVGRAVKLVLTTVGYGSLLYAAQLFIPAAIAMAQSHFQLPQLSTNRWTGVIVVVLSFTLPLRLIPLRLLPAFVLGGVAFEFTSALFQSLIKATYAEQVKRSVGHNQELDVYEYKRHFLHMLLGIGQNVDHPLLASLHNNAHCAAGVVAVGSRQASTLAELKQYLLTGDARSDEEKQAVIEHEKGHAETRTFFNLVKLYLCHVVLQACSKPSFALVLVPISAASAWTLSSWCDELVADMRAGRRGLLVSLQPCPVRVERNTTEGDEETHVVREISHALRPPDSVHIDHTDECAGGAPSPCNGELGPASHPPSKWRYNAFLYGDQVYPWLAPLLSAVGSAFCLSPLIDPLRPVLDAAAVKALEELRQEEKALK